MDSLTGVLSAALPFRVVLACPIAMFLMMRSMGGMSHSTNDPATRTPDDRLAQLEMEQAALSQRIAAARADMSTPSVSVSKRRAS
jgi:hypothetical protein